MNLKNVSLPLMQPGDDNDFITSRESLNRRHRERFHFQPDIWRAF
jgi:hypothetical protein